jgi:DNA-binding beta-propeller fold protein YncE
MQKISYRLLRVALSVFFLGASTSNFAAAVLNVIPNALSANLNLTGLIQIVYTVTNNTHHLINQITIDPDYLSTGNTASISLSENSCASITLAPNASCTFSVDVTDGVIQPASFTIRPRVCGYNGQVCSVPLITNQVQIKTVPRAAFISNYGNNTLSNCTVNADGTLGTCGQLQDPTFAGPTSTAFNPLGTILYVSNFNNNTVSVCPINSNGVLSPCTSIGDPSFNGPNSIASNLDGTFAYVANYNGNTVSICPINQNGIIGTCTASPQAFFAPNTIKLNAKATFAYVTNHSNNTVAACSINPNGAFGTCNASNPSATFNGPTGITLNPQGTIAYMSNSANVGGNRNISICQVNIDGSLGSCSAYISTLFNFNNFGKIAVDAQNTFVYVVNQTNNYLSLCSIIENGLIGSCSQVNDNTFLSPQGIAVN